MIERSNYTPQTKNHFRVLYLLVMSFNRNEVREESYDTERDSYRANFHSAEQRK